MKKVLLVMSLAIGGGLLSACKTTEIVRSTSAPADSVVAVTINISALSTIVGQTTQLIAEARNAAGTVVVKPATWTSSDVSRATVSPTGVVTGIAAGVAFVRATVGGVVAQVPVAIAEVPVSVVLLTPSSTTLLVGQTITPTVSLRGPNNQTLTNRFVSWSSSNSTVALVNGLGTITAISSGTSTILATSEGKTAAFTVTVTMIPVSTVALSASTPLYVGRTTQLLLTLRDADGNVLPLSGRNIIWSTSDNSKLSISNTGVVTGLSSGVTTVVAVVEGKVGIFAATMELVPINIVVITAPALLTPLSIGGTRQFTATALDILDTPLTVAMLAGRQFVWATETPSRLAISANGLVTAIEVGDAIVRVGIAGVTTRTTVSIVN